MDRKSVQLEMKPAWPNVTARTGLLVVAVLVICSVFLLCNYFLVNQRIAAMEERLETLQRSERQNPNVNDQGGAKPVLHVRKKTAVSLADLEKRLLALEKRYLALNSSVISNVKQVTALRLCRYRTHFTEPDCFLYIMNFSLSNHLFKLCFN